MDYLQARYVVTKICRLYGVSLLVTLIWSLWRIAILQVMLQKIHLSLQRNTLHCG